MSISICVIGLGAVGKKRFELFQNDPRVNNVFFFDPTIKKYNNVKSYETTDSVFADKSTDAIVISTPNKQKKDLILRGFDSDKHIFCEKPPSLSFDDINLIASHYRRTNQLRLQFGFNHRYLSHYKRLKEIISANIYGQPLWVRGIYGKGFDDSFYQSWRANEALSGGGIFLDQGIHMLDLALDLLGDLEVHNVLLDSAKDHSGIDINAFIHLRSHKGVPVSLHSSMLQWRHTFRLEVGTEQAIVGIDGVKSSTKSYGDESIRIDRHWQDNFVESQVNQYTNPDYYTFRDECNDFVSAIVNNQNIVHGTLEDAVRIMALVDKIYSYT